MNAVSTWLAAQPWRAIVAMLVLFLAWVALLSSLRRRAARRSSATSAISGEHMRKLAHVGSGLLTLAFPLLFAERWPVLLLTGLSAVLMAGLKWWPPLRAASGGLLGDDGRSTLGEIYFPVAVAAVFSLALGRPAWLFGIPVLVLTFADAAGALVGTRYGRTRMVGTAKSVEGSIAVALVTFVCVCGPLIAWSGAATAAAVLMAATLALLVTLLEGSAWRGLDNLFIPLGVYFLLSAWIDLDIASLLARFIVTVLLVGAIVSSRQRTTMQDDALLAGAFLAYVTWALMEWRWLLPPAAAYAGYAWMSPRTVENSRRIHQVGMVIAVWAAAMAWLALGRVNGDGRALFPFALVFASHLAIFGTSRLASDFPARPVAPLAVSAVVKAWTLCAVPTLLIDAASARTLLLALSGVTAVALGVALFAWSGPSLRHVTLGRMRWVRQAACAATGSVVGWTMLCAIDAWRRAR